MLAVTVLLLLHSAAPATHNADTHSARSKTTVVVSSSANSPVNVADHKESADKGHDLGAIVVLPASAWSLPPLKGETKLPHKQSGGAGMFHKLGSAFHSTPKEAAAEPAPVYTHPDSDFSFDTDQPPASQERR